MAMVGSDVTELLVGSAGSGGGRISPAGKSGRTSYKFLAVV
jgi:hypothetical protein